MKVNLFLYNTYLNFGNKWLRLVIKMFKSLNTIFQQRIIYIKEVVKNAEESLNVKFYIENWSG